MMKYMHWFYAIVLITVSCNQAPSETIPEFNIRLHDSVTIFNTRQIPTGKPVVIVHFASDCKDCQDETDTLLKYMDKLSNVQFKFITVEKFRQVGVFRDHYGLENFNNITVGQDYDKAFAIHFKSRKTPFMAVYNKDKELKAVFEGKAKMEDFLSVIASIE